MHKITANLKEHYGEQYSRFGSTSEGVDWGKDKHSAESRQLQMLGLVLEGNDDVSLLDVGCGYGHLADLILRKNMGIEYSGVDVVPEMIRDARKRLPQFNFYNADFLDAEISDYDYLVCNGILTQKLSATTLEMNMFFADFVRKMYNHAKVGIAFNVMSTFVNFQNEKLYYRNPSETLAWCMTELSPHVVLNSAYKPWFEYTVYVYKPKVIRK